MQNKFTERYDHFQRRKEGEPPTLEEMRKKIAAIALNKDMNWSEVRKFYERELLNNKNISSEDLKELENLYKQTLASIHAHGGRPEKKDDVIQSFGLFVRDLLAGSGVDKTAEEVIDLYLNNEALVTDQVFERIKNEKGLYERLEALYQKMLDKAKNNT